MKFYNPTTKEVTTFGNLKIRYNISSPNETESIGFYKLIDKIDEYGDSPFIAENFVPGTVVKTNQGYVRLITPSTGINEKLQEIEQTKLKVFAVANWIKSQIPAWDGASSYNAGDYVTYEDQVWLATGSSLDNSPDDNEPEVWSSQDF